MRIDFKELKSETAGKWDSIIPVLDGRISDIEAGGNAAPCPVHGGSDGFRLFRDFALTGGGVCNTCGVFSDGLSLLQWLAGEHNVRPAALRVNALIGTGDIQQAPQSTKAPPAKNKAPIKKAAIKQWGTANIPVNAYARRYFENRGLDPVGKHEALRYHDGAPFFDGRLALVGPDNRWLLWPAILARMTNAGGVSAGLVQIYLTNDGYQAGVEIQKAGAKNPASKKFMSYAPLVGCAVRVGDVGEDLAITEGVETGLAVRQLTGLPVAMCCTGALMRNVEIPEGVKRVHIFADKDRNGAGINAAEFLRDALLAGGYECKIHLPDMAIPETAKGVDWLDYLSEYPDTKKILIGS